MCSSRGHVWLRGVKFGSSVYYILVNWVCWVLLRLLHSVSPPLQKLCHSLRGDDKAVVLNVVRMSSEVWDVWRGLVNFSRCHASVFCIPSHHKRLPLTLIFCIGARQRTDLVFLVWVYGGITEHCICWLSTSIIFLSMLLLLLFMLVCILMFVLKFHPPPHCTKTLYWILSISSLALTCRENVPKPCLEARTRVWRCLPQHHFLDTYSVLCLSWLS